VNGNDGTVWYLSVQEEVLGAAGILRLEGRVSSATSGDLARALDRFCDGNCRALVVDLTTCDYINGQGLSVIERAAARLRFGDRELIIFGLCPVVQTAFDLSGAIGRVTVESSRESALRRATGLNAS
jgi:anti-anti-sigma factor